MQISNVLPTLSDKPVNYRQYKGKVMFSPVCVKLFTGGEGSQSHDALGMNHMIHFERWNGPGRKEACLLPMGRTRQEGTQQEDEQIRGAMVGIPPTESFYCSEEPAQRLWNSPQ